VILAVGSLVGLFGDADGRLAAAPVAMLVRHPQGHAEQPGPQGASGVPVGAPAPHHQEHLLGQVLGVRGRDAHADERAVDVVEVRLEDPHADVVRCAPLRGPSRRG
jgi:hypothetical protein